MQNRNIFQGFIPVNGNWDLLARDGCTATPRNRKRGTCQNCGNPANACTCAGKENNYTVEACCPNTYIRDTEEIVAVRTGDSCACNAKTQQTTAQRKPCGCQAECTCGTYAEPTCGAQTEYTATRKPCGCKGECSCGAYAEPTCGAQTEYTATRKSCGCQAEHTCPQTAQPACTNACAQNTGRNAGCPAWNPGVGMVKGTNQEICATFQNESALRAGTLFPELHKPMNGYCPYESNCGTPCQAAAFAAWELRLYLDTHPNDAKAMAMLQRIENQLADPNYATTFLPEGSDQDWTWVNDPWPWQFDCSCGN